MKAIKGVISFSLALGLTAYLPDNTVKEIKASEAAQVSASNEWGGTISPTPPKNDGDTYHIYNGEELAWIAEQVNAGLNFEGKTIILEDDIDLAFKPWIPIGDDVELPFMGTFEGNGKTISNLQLVNNSNSSFVGLFGVTKNAILQNFIIDHVQWNKGSTASQDYKNIGVVSADLLNSKAVDITVNDADISGTENLAAVGGITCVLSNSSWIISCTVKNSIFQGRNPSGIVSDWEMVPDEQLYGKYGPGGIINCASINNEITLNYISAGELCAGSIVANLNTSITDKSKIGGLYFFNNYAVGTINASSSITSVNSHIGGLIGAVRDNYANPFYFANNYTAAVITNGSDLAINIGSVIGTNKNTDLNISNIYYSDINGSLNPVGSDVLSLSAKMMQKSDAVMKTENFGKTMNVGVLDLKSEFLPVDSQGNRFSYANWQEGVNVYPGFALPAAEGIEVYPAAIEKGEPVIRINANGKVQLHAMVHPNSSNREDKIVWAIDADDTVSVNSEGILTANNAVSGSVHELTVSASGIIKKIKVEILADNVPQSLKINYPGIIKSGMVKKLSVTTDPINADLSNLVWKINEFPGTSNPSYVNEIAGVASLSDTGELLAIGAGKAEVSVLYRTYDSSGDERNIVMDTYTILIEDTVWDGEASKQPIKKTDGYHITMPSELKWLADRVNEGNNFSAETFILDNDIDLNNKPWVPIGDGTSLTHYFAGTFDGSGYTIKNVFTSDKTRELNALFGWVSAAMIKNLTVDGIRSVGNAVSMTPIAKSAGIVGNASSVTLDNVSVRNAEISGYYYAGGLIAYAADSHEIIIKNCSVNNTVVKGNNAGGLIGALETVSGSTAAYGKIINSSFSGTVNSQDASQITVSLGGLVGKAGYNKADKSLMIENSYSIGSVSNSITAASGTSVNVGGIIGYSGTNLLINNVYSVKAPQNTASGNANIGSIGGFVNDVYGKMQKVYTIESQLNTVGNTPSFSVIKMSDEDMKKASFAALLNADAAAIEGAQNWQSRNDYPTFTNGSTTVVTIQQENQYLKQGEKIKLNVKITPYISSQNIQFMWSISPNTDSITVNEAGEVNVSKDAPVHSSAVVTMHAYLDGELLNEDQITVYVIESDPIITSLKIKDYGVIETGESIQLLLETEPKNIDTSNAIWTIQSGFDKASITPTGMLTTTKAGTIVVRVNLNGVIAEKSLTIKLGSKWDGITIEEPEIIDKEIYITKPSELAWLAQETNNGDMKGFDGHNIILMNSLDLNEQDWTPIGTEVSPFRGNFNGNYKTISNLYLKDKFKFTGDGRNAGLFGTASNAEFNNLIIDNTNINAIFSGNENDYASTSFGMSGTLAAQLINNSSIESIIIRDSNISSNGFTGGLVGSINDSEIKNSSFEGQINGRDQAAGLAAKVNNTLMLNCSVTADISLMPRSWSSAGGIAGECSGGNVQIINSYYQGTIKINNNGSPFALGGGILGSLYGGTEVTSNPNTKISVINSYAYFNAVGPTGYCLNGIGGNGTIWRNNNYETAYSSYTLSGGISEKKDGTSGNLVEKSIVMQASSNPESLASILNENIKSLSNINDSLNKWYSSETIAPQFITEDKVKISVSPTFKMLLPGESLQLEKVIEPFGAPDIAVSFISNSSYVSVNNEGLVKVASNAPVNTMAIITMKPIGDGFTQKDWSNCVIMVGAEKPKPEILTITAKNNIEVNASMQITLTATPENADLSEIVWKVSNNTLAQISDGLFKSKGQSGKVTVWAESSDGTVISNKLIITIKDKTPAWDGSIEKPNIEGRVIHIQNGAQLAWIGEQTNLGNYDGFKGYTIYIDNDLDLGSIPWTPIGNKQYSFQGSLNGSGHKILNLLNNDRQKLGGLFGHISDAYIYNLSLTDAVLDDAAGGFIAYYASGNTRIRNVNMIGYLCNISQAADDLETPNNIGGMISEMDENGTASIEINQCYVDLSLANISNVFRIGGLIGSAVNSNSVIRNNRVILSFKDYNTGLSNGDQVEQNIGGIIGYTRMPIILQIENNAVEVSGNFTGEYAYSLRYGAVLGTIIGVDVYARSGKISIMNNYIKNNVTSSIKTYFVYRINHIFGCYDGSPYSNFQYKGYLDMRSDIAGVSYFDSGNMAVGGCTDPIKIVNENTVKVTSMLADAPASDPNALVNKLNQWVNNENKQESENYRSWAVIDGKLTFGEASSIQLSVNELSMAVNDSYTLKAIVTPNSANQTVTWHSSDDKIASITQEGVIQALLPGKVTITATTLSGLSDTCTVTIGAMPTSVSIHFTDGRSDSKIQANTETSLHANVLPENAVNKHISWSSDDDSIISIKKNEADEDAVIIGHKAGKTTIHAMTENGIRASMDIEVAVPINKLAITGNGAIDEFHPMQKYEPIFNEDATEKEVIWKVYYYPDGNAPDPDEELSEENRTYCLTEHEDGSVTLNLQQNGNGYLNQGSYLLTVTSKADESISARHIIVITSKMIDKITIKRPIDDTIPKIYFKELFDLNVKIEPEGVEEKDAAISYTLDNEHFEIVTKEDGSYAIKVLDSASFGETVTVTATSALASNDEVQDSLTLMVGWSALTDLTIMRADGGAIETEIPKGLDIRLKAVPIPAAATNPTVSWKVENIGEDAGNADPVASIDEEIGILTPIRSGTVRVTATSKENAAITKSVDFTVIEKDPEVITVREGTDIFVTKTLNALQLNVDFSPSDTTNRKLIYSVIENPKGIAAIDSDGMITFNKDGENGNIIGQMKIRITPEGDCAPLDVSVTVIESQVYAKAITDIIAEDETLHAGDQIRLTPIYTIESDAELSDSITLLPNQFTWRIIKAESEGVIIEDTESLASIASIDNGMLTVYKEAVITIEVSAMNKEGLVISYQKELTAEKAVPKAVLFNVTDLTLYKGSKMAVKAIVKPDVVPSQKVRWTSNDPSLVHFEDAMGNRIEEGSEAEGMLYIVADGKAGSEIILTAEAADSAGISSQIKTVILSSAASGVKINPASSEDKPITLRTEGEKLQLSATVLSENGDLEATDQSVVWVSSDDTVAAVDQYGMVTPLKSGHVVITATSNAGGYQASSYIEVKPADLSELRLSETEMIMLKGKEKTLTVSANSGSEINEFEWSVSDPQILELIPVEGRRDIVNIKALKAGSASVYVKAKDQTAVCNIQVTLDTVLTESIRLYGPEEKPEVGQVFLVNADISPDTASSKTLLWESMDDAVEVVEGYEIGTVGMFRVIKEANSVLIKATANDDSGISKTLRVDTAGVSATGLTLSEQLIEIGSNDSQGIVIEAYFTPENVKNKTIRWSSENIDLITLSPNGTSVRIRPIAGLTVTGSQIAKVTATSADGRLSADCYILIKEIKAKGIQIMRSKIDVIAGSETELPVTILPENASEAELIWESDNPNAAYVQKIDGSYKIVSVGEGSTNVRARLKDNNAIVSNDCIITVSPAPQLESIKIIGNCYLRMGESQVKYTLLSNPYDLPINSEEIIWSITEGLNTVVSIDENGLVSTIAAGTAVLTAAVGDINASLTIHVAAADQEIVHPVISAEITDLPVNNQMIVGSMHLLKAVLNAESGEPDNQNVMWISSDPNILSIDEQSGLMIAKQEGVAEITLVTSGMTAETDGIELPITAQTTIEVINDSSIISNLSITPSEADLPYLSVADLKAVYEGEATLSEVTWTSSDSTIAEVVPSADNPMRATLHVKEKSGDVTIMLSVNGHTAFSVIHVSAEAQIPVTSIEVPILQDQSVITLYQGVSLQLDAAVNESATNKKLTYLSNNEHVTVSEEGLISAVSPGISAIVIKPEDTDSIVIKTILVLVEEDPILTIDKLDVSAAAGGSLTLKGILTPTNSNADFVWTLSEGAEAMLTELPQTNGETLTLNIKEGLENYTDFTCTLTVAAGGKVFTASSTVHPLAASSITSVEMRGADDQLISVPLILSVGTDHELKALVTAAEGADSSVKWVSSNPSIVSITEGEGNTAVIHGDSAGTAVISAFSSADASKAAVLTVRVNGSETEILSISISVDKPTLEIGKTTTASVSVDPDTESQRVMFTSSSPEVASVDQSGVITGLKTGRASIIVTSLLDPSKSDSVLVKVVEPTPIPVGFEAFTLKTIDGSQGYDKAVIDPINKTVTITVPLLTNRERLIADFKLDQADAYAKVGNEIQVSNVTENNYSSPLTYTLMDAKGNKTEYSITVEYESISGEDAAITAFAFKQDNNSTLKQDYTGVINNTEIVVMMDKDEELSNLVASFTTKDALSVNAMNKEQISGESVNSYTGGLVYSLFGTNKKTVNYTVKIDQGPVLKTIALSQAETAVQGMIKNNTVTFVLNEKHCFDFTQPILADFETKSQSEVKMEGLQFKKDEAASSRVKDVYKASVRLSDDRGEAAAETYVFIIEIHKEERFADMKTFKVSKDALGNEAFGTVTMDKGYIFIDVAYDMKLDNVYVHTESEPTDAEIVMSVEANEDGSYDLTQPLSITVQAEGFTPTVYSVIVRRAAAPSEQTALTQFILKANEISYLPTKYGNIWIYSLPYETDLTQIQIEAAADDQSLIELDGEAYSADKVYDLSGKDEITVTVSKDGLLPSTTIIRIQKSTVPSNQAVISSFELKKEDVVISKKSLISNDLILVTVPFGTDLSSVDYGFISEIEGLNLKVNGQAEGTENHDFSNTPLTLTACAAGYADKEYRLIINVESGSAKITKVQIGDVEAIPDDSNTIHFELPRGTDLKSVVPSFTLSDSKAKVLINQVEYVSGTAIDLSREVTVVVEIDGIKEVYMMSAAIHYGPVFTGKIRISQKITTETGTETVILTASPDNENGTVVFEAEAGLFDLTKPFTISYTTADGSTLYEGENEVVSESAITLSAEEKNFTLKSESEESIYTMKIVEKAFTGIDITKFDLIDVPNAGTISGRIDHERRRIYLDVLVDYTEDFTAMTLDIEAAADMILLNGRVVNGPITLNLTNTMTATFMKDGEAYTYEVITSSVVEGPYVTSFEILDTKEGTLTGVIDNKNKVISVETPMSISTSQLGFVEVNIQSASMTNESSIEITGDYYDGYMMLDTLTSNIILVQDGIEVKYTINIVRPFINGDMNSDGVLTSADVILLSSMIN